MELQESPSLVRAMGRWTLTALVINSIIGSGIFGLPSVVAGYVAAGVRSLILSARWPSRLSCCVLPKSPRNSANPADRIYFPGSIGPLCGNRNGLAFLALTQHGCRCRGEPLRQLSDAILVRGTGNRSSIGDLRDFDRISRPCELSRVKSGAAASNVFTAAKLSALFFFAEAGAVFLFRMHPAAPRFTPGSAFPVRNWFEAMLAITFAYGGLNRPSCRWRKPRIRGAMRRSRCSPRF